MYVLVMKNIIFFLSLILMAPAFSQVGGSYSAARPVDCTKSNDQNVHQMRPFLIEDNEEEFVVHLTSKVGVCFNNRFSAQALSYDYETTFIPERFFFKEPFDADFIYTEGQRQGEIIMRFEKKKLVKKHNLQKLDFYFGVHGKGHYPIYFKWYVSVILLPNGQVKFATSYQGHRSQIK